MPDVTVPRPHSITVLECGTFYLSDQNNIRMITVGVFSTRIMLMVNCNIRGMLINFLWELYNCISFYINCLCLYLTYLQCIIIIIKNNCILYIVWPNTMLKNNSNEWIKPNKTVRKVSRRFILMFQRQSQMSWDRHWFFTVNKQTVNCVELMQKSDIKSCAWECFHFLLHPCNMQQRLFKVFSMQFKQQSKTA